MLTNPLLDLTAPSPALFAIPVPVAGAGDFAQTLAELLQGVAPAALATIPAAPAGSTVPAAMPEDRQESAAAGKIAPVVPMPAATSPDGKWSGRTGLSPAAPGIPVRTDATQRVDEPLASDQAEPATPDPTTTADPDEPALDPAVAWLLAPPISLPLAAAGAGPVRSAPTTGEIEALRAPPPQPFAMRSMPGAQMPPANAPLAMTSDVRTALPASAPMLTHSSAVSPPAPIATDAGLVEPVPADELAPAEGETTTARSVPADAPVPPVRPVSVPPLTAGGRPIVPGAATVLSQVEQYLAPDLAAAGIVADGPSLESPDLTFAKPESAFAPPQPVTGSAGRIALPIAPPTPILPNETAGSAVSGQPTAIAPDARVQPALSIPGLSAGAVMVGAGPSSGSQTLVAMAGLPSPDAVAASVPQPLETSLRTTSTTVVVSPATLRFEPAITQLTDQTPRLSTAPLQSAIEAPASFDSGMVPAESRADAGPLSPASAPLASIMPVSAAPDASSGAGPGIDLTGDPGVHRMIGHIERLRDAADANDTRIRLIPDALGPVEVAVQREGEGVSVHFIAAEPAARQLIADAAPRLTELAEARGVRIERATVDTAGQGGGDAQARQHPQPNPAPAAPRAPTRSLTEPATDADHRIA